MCMNSKNMKDETPLAFKLYPRDFLKNGQFWQKLAKLCISQFKKNYFFQISSHHHNYTRTDKALCFFRGEVEVEGKVTFSLSCQSGFCATYKLMPILCHDFLRDSHTYHRQIPDKMQENFR